MSVPVALGEGQAMGRATILATCGSKQPGRLAMISATPALGGKQ